MKRRLARLPWTRSCFSSSSAAKAEPSTTSTSPFLVPLISRETFTGPKKWLFLPSLPPFLPPFPSFLSPPRPTPPAPSTPPALKPSVPLPSRQTPKSPLRSTCWTTQVCKCIVVVCSVVSASWHAIARWWASRLKGNATPTPSQTQSSRCSPSTRMW